MINKYLKWSLIATGAVAAVAAVYFLTKKKDTPAIAGAANPTTGAKGVESYLDTLQKSGIKINVDAIKNTLTNPDAPVGSFKQSDVVKRFKALGITDQKITNDLLALAGQKADYLKGLTFISTIYGILASARGNVFATDYATNLIAANRKLGNTI